MGGLQMEKVDVVDVLVEDLDVGGVTDERLREAAVVVCGSPSPVVTCGLK